MSAEPIGEQASHPRADCKAAFVIACAITRSIMLFPILRLDQECVHFLPELIGQAFRETRKRFIKFVCGFGTENDRAYRRMSQRKIQGSSSQRHVVAPANALESFSLR